MAEEAKIDISINGGGAAKTLGELEERSERLNQALREAEIGSKEYKQLNQQLVETNRQVKNLELGFEALDNEQVAGEIGSVAGAIGDVTAAMILLGGENEELEEMARNIEMALGVSMAFKGAIEGFSSAFKLFNNVLKTSPIFILVGVLTAIGVGIGFMVANWDKFVKAVKGSVGAILDFFQILVREIGSFNKALDDTALKEMALAKIREQNHNSETQRRKDAIKQIEDERDAKIEALDETNRELNRQIEINENIGKSSDALTIQVLENELEKVKAIRDANQKILNEAIDHHKRLAELNGESEQDYIDRLKRQGIDLEDAQNRANEIIAENEKEVELAESRITKLKRDQHERRSVDAKAQADEENRIRQEAYQAELDRLHDLQAEQNDFYSRLEKVTNDFYDSQLDAQTREENAVRDKYFTLIEEAIKYGEDTTELERMRQAELDAIKQEYELKEAERQQAIREESARIEQERLDAENAAREERIANAEELANNLFTIANSSMELLHGKELKRAKEKMQRGEALTKHEEKLIRREEALRKAQALAQIASDTARGISGAIAAGAGIPFPGNLLAIASGIASVFSGVAQAAQVLGESSGIPSVSDVSQDQSTDATIQETPRINEVQSGSTVFGMNKVYVLEQDITDTQNNVSVIEGQAQFG